MIHTDIKSGDIVVATYGYNPILKQPNKFLYEFGYQTNNGNMVVYIKGERNMQDSYSFDKSCITKATDEDIKNIPYGH